MYRVNVSSIQDFMQCRFRWWCKWIMNRVPVNESPALGAGKLLHLIFEDAANGGAIDEAAASRLAQWATEAENADPVTKINADKAIQVVRDLEGALPLWEDKFPVDEVLEVEESFEVELPEYPGILWLGRPDRVVSAMKQVWHTQRRGLAASMNFGTYVVLAKRHYHEHLYAEHLARKYCKPFKKRSKLKYGGTWFDLMRKLKYRTYVGKKNEATKTAAEMFWQGPMSVNLDSGLHKAVMHSMAQHVNDMKLTEHLWELDQYIPPPNEKMNGGYGGNAMDPYFRVLVGEISLDDDTWFKDRVDMYEVQDAAD